MRRRALGLKLAADRAEPRRVGALEAVDRLLLVADREQRAQPLAAPSPAKNSAARLSMIAPLRRVGVLRLVDQDVVDAAVDLVEHPGGGAGARQQDLRLDDQVVIVERGLRPLAPLVIGLHRVGEREHRGARLGHAQMRAFEMSAANSRLCAVPAWRESRARRAATPCCRASRAAHASSVRNMARSAAARGAPSGVALAACRPSCNLWSRAGRRVRCSGDRAASISVIVEHVGERRGQRLLGLVRRQRRTTASALAPSASAQSAGLS